MCVCVCVCVCVYVCVQVVSLTEGQTHRPVCRCPQPDVTHSAIQSSMICTQRKSSFFVKMTSGTLQMTMCLFGRQQAVSKL